VICNIYWQVVNCDHLARDTWHWLLDQVMCTGAVTWQCLKCPRWLHVYLMCSICYQYAMYIHRHNKVLSISVCYPIFWKSLYITYINVPCITFFSHTNCGSFAHIISLVSCLHFTPFHTFLSLFYIWNSSHSCCTNWDGNIWILVQLVILKFVWDAGVSFIAMGRYSTIQVYRFVGTDCVLRLGGSWS
jgi:hypothetical protein